MHRVSGRESLLASLRHQHDGPLRDRVVVQLGNGLAGMFAAGLLADLGACAVLVESRERAQQSLRRLGRSLPGEDSLYFQVECRGTYSIAVDEAEEAAVLRALLGHADLLIEDLGPGGLERCGLTDDALTALNPDLCTLRISPFGQTGPLAHAGGNDRTAQAFSGMTHVTGYTDRPPMPVTVPLAEYWTGLNGANGALIAMLHAMKGGGGQQIDLALYETPLRLQEEAIIQYDQLGIVRERMGNEYAETVPSNHYETADGRWVAISAAGDAPFARVCEAIDAPEATTDPRFSSVDARRIHRDHVNDLIAAWVRRHPLSEVTERFAARSAPIATVQSSQEMLADPHMQERRNFVHTTTPTGRPLTLTAPVPRLSESRSTPARPAPTLDQDGSSIRAWMADQPIPPSPPRAARRAEAGLPLEGIRVLDLGQYIAAPFAATLLADFGAEVIKVELPDGESTRSRYPARDGVGLSYLITNRNKRSITLDLHRSEAVELLLDLVAEADVVLENFRPGTLERFGLAPDALQARNPRLVVGRLSGFGQTGPYRGRSAFDRIGLAMGGISHVGGYPDRPPLRPGVLAADYSAGLFGCFGTLAALVGTVNGDTGRIVDASLYESILRMMGDTCTLYATLGEVRHREGPRWPLYPDSITEVCSDGVTVTASPPRDDPAALVEARAWMCTVSHEAVAERLGAAGWTVTRVNSVESIVDHPHVVARGNVVTLQHDVLGAVRMQGVIPRLTRTPGSVRGYSRAPGSDNDYVLRHVLGLPDSRIDELTSPGARFGIQEGNDR